MDELGNIKRRLDSDNRYPYIPSQTLEKAMFFPEDEIMPKGFKEKPYPGIGESLFANPFPAVAKKGKKKKKK